MEFLILHYHSGSSRPELRGGFAVVLRSGETLCALFSHNFGGSRKSESERVKSMTRDKDKSLQLDKPTTQGRNQCLRAISGAKFAENMFHMNLNRLFGGQ